MTTRQHSFGKRPPVIVTLAVVAVVAAFVALPLVALIADAIWGRIATVIYG